MQKNVCSARYFPSGVSMLNLSLYNLSVGESRCGSAGVTVLGPVSPTISAVAISTVLLGMCGAVTPPFHCWVEI